MPKYFCKICTSSGQVLEREFEADSPDALQRSLDADGFCLLKLKERRFSMPATFGRRSRMSATQFISFNQELLVLLRAGLPILHVLESLQENLEKGPLHEVLHKIRDDVKGGRRLSDAFGDYPQFFPPLYLASLRAGEQTGDLPVTLQRFLDYFKRMEAIRGRVKAALFYPSLLLLAVAALLLFMMIFVIPRFSRIYADANVQLPLITRLLIGATDGFMTALPWLVIGLPAAVLGLRFALGTGQGRLWWDRLRLRLPLLGVLMRHYALLNFNRTVATILNSGLPVLAALDLAGRTLTNRELEQRLGQVVEAVRQGGKLSVACREAAFLPPMAVRLVAAGESAGALQEMLSELAGYLEDDVDRRLQRLTTMIEPLVMIFMGLVIGGLVVAMYLPIFKIGGTV
jgi:type IV pilus assembly protein PilC